MHQTIQCPTGLLISVDGTSSKKTGPTTSDLLVYGLLSPCTRPPTPPHSSPVENNEHANTSKKPYGLKLYAVPLSSGLLTQAQAFPSPPPSSDGERLSTPAEFLPDISSPSPKRKRVATLFEVAAQHHRRVRQRGGEAVSQLMAPSRPVSSSQNLQSLRIKREPEDETPSLPTLDRLTSRRSRSVSVGTNLQRPGTTRSARATPALNADPQKRAATPNLPMESHSRHGSLHVQPQSLSTEQPDDKTSTTPPSPPKNPESIIAENKNLITRTILTCMRLYGFHRSNTRSGSRRVSGGTGDDAEALAQAPAAEGIRAETPAPGATADDDEFKSMYHATYRAAAFALRKYLRDSTASAGTAPLPLEKEKAMTCIDEILRLFCEDL